MSDPVNHPDHYNSGKFEVIEVIEDWNLGFCTGNAVKYLARADLKGKPIEDLEKARWYLDYEIRKRVAARDLVKKKAAKRRASRKKATRRNRRLSAKL